MTQQQTLGERAQRPARKNMFRVNRHPVPQHANGKKNRFDARAPFSLQYSITAARHAENINNNSPTLGRGQTAASERRSDKQSIQACFLTGRPRKYATISKKCTCKQSQLSQIERIVPDVTTTSEVEVVLAVREKEDTVVCRR